MSRDYLSDSAVERSASTQRRWLGVCAGLALVLLALSAIATAASNLAAPATTSVSTPTPGIPRRDYDPPAPPDVLLPAEVQRIQVAVPGGYPRIVKLWGGYEADASGGIDFYAQYDVLITSGAFTVEQLRYLRGKNPDMIVLYTGLGTYDLDDGPLGSQWVGASEGSREFECFYRGTNDQVLKVDFWNHGMFNLGDEWCADEIVAHLSSAYSPGIYDGVFFDRVNQAIAPHILHGIDLDHDGTQDDLDVVNELCWRGTERLLDKVREALGDSLIIVANDAPLPYTTRLHGREYESFVRDILDEGADWPWFRTNYEQWTQASRRPPLTMVMANPPYWMELKYGHGPWTKMEEAVVSQAASYYRRMRFGLTTALMEDGLYSFEFGTTWHGNAWWYDEFDGAGLGKGYLGMPLGDAYYATGPLTTTNIVQNPGFEEPGLVTWTLQTLGDAQAAVEAVPVTATYAATDTTIAACILITSSDQIDDVRLDQANIALESDRAYTLSFWGRASDQLCNVRATLHANDLNGTLYGLSKVLELGTTWQQYWVPFTSTATISNAVLSLAVGQRSGTVWFDEVTLQEGALPTVFRRDFERGIALCNATDHPATVPLSGTYYRLDGTQAPRVQIIIDDSAESTDVFTKTGVWDGPPAGYEDWGTTYHYALTTIDPDGVKSSVTWRPEVPQADHYSVYAWIAPHDLLSDTITYTVQHAGGVTPVAVNPTVSEPDWVSLGTYLLEAGAGHCVTLTNETRSTWVIADAVKFESMSPYNDGRPATHVDLEGQDGIILLNESPRRAHLAGVTLLGPPGGYTGTAYAYTAVITPTNVTSTVTYAWTPPPATGQGTAVTSYLWGTPGSYTVTVSAVGEFATFMDSRVVSIQALPAPAASGDEYEDDGLCAQAAVIHADERSQVHTFHTYGDVDWVSVAATPGITYVVRARVPPDSAADVVMEAFEACSGSPTASSLYTFTPDARVVLTPSGGSYYFALRNLTPAVYGSQVVYHLSVRSLPDQPASGALVLVAGQYADDDALQPNVQHVTDGLYQLGRSNGCTADQIYYLGQGEGAMSVNDKPSRKALQYALTEWAVDRVGPAGPLTLYLAGHAGDDRFYLDRNSGEWVSPSEVGAWLGQLGQDVAAQIIVDAPRSAGFIDPPDTAVQEHRVVIASTGSVSAAYASRQGLAFSDALLTALRQGMSLDMSFEEGAWALRQTHPEQAPSLDANGNGLSNEVEDVERATEARLGCVGGWDPSRWPPHIAQVQVLEWDANSRQLWAQVWDDSGIDRVWAVVHPPLRQPLDPGEQLIPEPRAIALQPGHGGWYGALSSQFSEGGAYRVVFYAQDDQGLLARPVAVVVQAGERSRLPLILKSFAGR